jgi:uncharacterized protein (DUF58 family)
MIDPLFDKIFRLLTLSPSGRRFEPVPWDDLNEQLREKLPFYLRVSLNPGTLILGISLPLFVFALLLPSKSLGAFSAGLVAAILFAWNRAWRQSEVWEISRLSASSMVHEGEKIELQGTIHNKGRTPLEILVLRLQFEGSTDRERFLLVNHLAAGEKRRFKVEFMADRGMGHFKFQDVMVVTSDFLGFFALCLSTPCPLAVEVLPEEIPLDEIEVKVAGLTMHSGAFELGVPGDSVSFLGLREWQHGDSIRHIDWKRSQRQGELLVKTFEKMCATDATVLFDHRLGSHVEFAGMSSLEALRDSAVAVVRQLLRQQLRVQFRSLTHLVPFGGGKVQENLLTQVIMQQNLVPQGELSLLLSDSLASIPPDSMLILMLSSVGTIWKDLWEQLLVLNDRRVDIILIVVDAAAFERKAAQDANLDAEQVALMDFMKTVQPDFHATSDLDRLIRKISERTWILGPHTSIGNVMREDFRGGQVLSSEVKGRGQTAGRSGVHAGKQVIVQ